MPSGHGGKSGAFAGGFIERNFREGEGFPRRVELHVASYDRGKRGISRPAEGSYEGTIYSDSGKKREAFERPLVMRKSFSATRMGMNEGIGSLPKEMICGGRRGSAEKRRL